MVGLFLSMLFWNYLILLPAEGSRVTPISTDMDDWGLKTWDDLSKVSGFVNGGQVPYLKPSALSTAFALGPAP